MTTNSDVSNRGGARLVQAVAIAIVGLGGGLLIRAGVFKHANPVQSRFFSMPEYTSIEELVQEADLFAVVAIRESRNAFDRGLDPVDPTAPDPSIPVVVYQGTVLEALGGRLAPPASIDLVIPRTDNLLGEQQEGISQFVTGEKVLMFLSHFAPSGVDGLKEAWAPLSYDNGTFDLAPGDGQVVFPRSDRIQAMRRADAHQGPLGSILLSDIRVLAAER
jgi:hypothetical protein